MKIQNVASYEIHINIKIISSRNRTVVESKLERIIEFDEKHWKKTLIIITSKINFFK